MPVTSSDLLFKLSVNSGPGDSTPQLDINDSIGGFMSSTLVSDGVSENLFDDQFGWENVELAEDYRCFFIHNTHATLSLIEAKVWISEDVTEDYGSEIGIALDPKGPVPAITGLAQAERLTSERLSPTVSGFVSPVTKNGGLDIEQIGPGQVQAIWLKRTAPGTNFAFDDSFTLRVEGASE